MAGSSLEKDLDVWGFGATVSSLEKDPDVWHFGATVSSLEKDPDVWGFGVVAVAGSSPTVPKYDRQRISVYN